MGLHPVLRLADGVLLAAIHGSANSRDALVSGRKFRTANLKDECIWECPAIEVNFSLLRERVCALLTPLNDGTQMKHKLDLRLALKIRAGHSPQGCSRGC